jgi:hypothetical protein
MSRAWLGSCQRKLDLSSVSGKEEAKGGGEERVGMGGVGNWPSPPQPSLQG